MIVQNKDGRKIRITGVYGREPDDIQVDGLEYLDGVGEVTEEDYDYVQDNFYDAIYEVWFENQIGAAEVYYEGDR